MALFQPQDVSMIIYTQIIYSYFPIDDSHINLATSGKRLHKYGKSQAINGKSHYFNDHFGLIKLPEGNFGGALEYECWLSRNSWDFHND